MIDAVQTGSKGLAAAAARFGAAAEQVARLGSEATETTLPDAARFDVSQTARDLIEAKAGFGANLAVVRAADAMTRRLLDVEV
ncbi:hypothetical protein [Methylobacterium trifolii]|uniref:Flagellar basal-body/hook protein C-terminal domain-containing protein n=1 Tax=Methylobacterium trifolii TaxID=1003092 RepID=A0ABQ4TZ76_9HYPH|nr:hypothetical protein [Methylobacterium trifolii]GJE60182.1 hypothetical protein MPOCJGCO_2293 [Methylobacterium trifolii]